MTPGLSPPFYDGESLRLRHGTRSDPANYKGLGQSGAFRHALYPGAGTVAPLSVPPPYSPRTPQMTRSDRPDITPLHSGENRSAAVACDLHTPRPPLLEIPPRWQGWHGLARSGTVWHGLAPGFRGRVWSPPMSALIAFGSDRGLADAPSAPQPNPCDMPASTRPKRMQRCVLTIRP